MIRMVMTVFPFNGMPKGLRFTYDTENDTGVEKFVRAGLLKDITEQEHRPDPTILQMPSIETSEEIGDIGGEGKDQPSDGAGEGPGADDASGQDGLQGDQGAVAKVAKKR